MPPFPTCLLQPCTPAWRTVSCNGLLGFRHWLAHPHMWNVPGSASDICFLLRLMLEQGNQLIRLIGQFGSRSLHVPMPSSGSYLSCIVSSTYLDCSTYLSDTSRVQIEYHQVQIALLLVSTPIQECLSLVCFPISMTSFTIP